MARTVKVAIAGLGPVGQAVARAVIATPGLKLVAATDPSPLIAGRDLGVVLGLPRKLKVKVEGRPERFFKKVRADVAFVCTSSHLKETKPQVAALLARRINVLTTCEELIHPVPARAAAFKELDRLAKRKKVSLLATGVNPGFAMDALALALTAPCARVRRVSVTRIVDAAARKLALQRRVGAGLNLNQFRRAVTDGTVRHVGLVESAHLIAAALGWKLDRITDEIQPKIAHAPVESQFLKVAVGRVCGIVQDGIGYVSGEPRIELHMEAYLGAPETYDRVRVEGSPRLDVKADGGYHGDVATASITVNTIPSVLAAAPGLHTMRSLALPSFAGK